MSLLKWQITLLKQLKMRKLQDICFDSFFPTNFLWTRGSKSSGSDVTLRVLIGLIILLDFIRFFSF
jgi:hypothetical protein